MNGPHQSRSLSRAGTEQITTMASSLALPGTLQWRAPRFRASDKNREPSNDSEGHTALPDDRRRGRVVAGDFIALVVIVVSGDKATN